VVNDDDEADIYRTIATPTRKPASPALGGISCTWVDLIWPSNEDGEPACSSESILAVEMIR
jgi:hypothetical protein